VSGGSGLRQAREVKRGQERECGAGRWGGDLQLVHHDIAHGDEVDGDIDGDEKSLQIADLHLREDHIDCAEDERGEGRGGAVPNIKGIR
jgi:hypothetical protein